MRRRFGREMARKWIEAVGRLDQPVRPTGLDSRIEHLVDLSASGIDHCAGCAKLHSQKALETGVSVEGFDAGRP